MTQSINIIIEGKEYTDFTSASVTKSIETLAGSFTFDATSTEKINFPIKVGSACQIVVKGTQVINGHIEKLTINYDATTHSIQIKGRERTADIIDSTLGSGSSTEFKTPISLKLITEKILQTLNLSDIKVIENIALKQFQQDNPSTEYGTSAFEFLEKYAKKRQVLLTTDGDGNIVFTRAPTQKYKTALILKQDAASTILSGSIIYDETKRFHDYFCATQDNPSGSTQFFKNAKESVDSSGTATDKSIRDSRIYHFEANFSSASETLNDRCKWESNFRRAQSKIWNYTVQGHIAEDDNMIWKPGYLVRVIDEFSNTNSILLISAVTYTEDLSEGTKTKLKIVTKESFTLEVNKPEKEKQTSQEGSTQYFSIPVPTLTSKFQKFEQRKK